MCKESNNDKRYRIKQFGEVFTPPNIVKDMCDLVKDATYNIETTFFEPACGDGAFLVELLERKLSVVHKDSKEEVYRAVSSIYGVDIQNDNVLKARKRMLEICKNVGLTEDTLEGCKKIINVNIVHGNTLPGDDGYGTMYVNGNMDEEYILMFYEWQFYDGKFRATPTTLGDKDEHFEKRPMHGDINILHKRLIKQIDVGKASDEFEI